MLDLVETIYHKTKDINIGGVTVYNDNLKLYRIIMAKNLTELMHIDKGSAEVARIREIIKEATISIVFRFIRGYRSITRLYADDPGLHLIAIYN